MNIDYHPIIYKSKILESKKVGTCLIQIPLRQSGHCPRPPHILPLFLQDPPAPIKPQQQLIIYVNFKTINTN